MLTGYNAINNTTDVTDATGNDGIEELPFPANMSSVISVIARDINNVDVAFSNVSSCKKSVSAPGVHLRTEDGFKSGTSFARFTNEECEGKPRCQNYSNNFRRTSADGNDFSYGLIQVDQAVAEAT